MEYGLILIIQNQGGSVRNGKWGLLIVEFVDCRLRGLWIVKNG